MTIKVHHLRPAPGAKTAKTRVGRGEGVQGQDRRSRYQGHRRPEERSGRLRGRQPAAAHAAAEAQGLPEPLPHQYQVVNVGQLATLFPQGGSVGVDELVEAGAVRKNELVKVLGDGDLDGVNLQVSGQRVLRLRQGEAGRRRRQRHHRSDAVHTH